MVSYKLSNDAQDDLIRIHQHGLRQFDEIQADRYYFKLIRQFDKIAAHPLLYQAVDDIRPGYRRCVCGSDSIYYRVLNSADYSVEIMAILGQQYTDR